MISSNDLMVFYMGLELQSLALYVLATFNRDQLKSSEAGLKYFVLSALSSGLLLYGCSLIYGFSGSTNFDLISNHQLKNYKDIPQTEYINQLSLQIHSPVMWSDTIKKIIETGVTKFIEIGPKKTLLNFIPKGLESEKLSITNNEDIDNYV